MTAEPIILSDEKFQEIYTNEKFRNEVAFAHGCFNEHSVFKYLSTCSYPIRYIVKEEQKKQAKEEREKSKKETIAKHENDLLFIGMGMVYEKRYDDDVCNHRIRTTFLNVEGEEFFIEVGTGMDDKTRCNHSIRKELKDDLQNYGGIERSDYLPKYTLLNVLKLVNNTFGCNFQKIVIDNYNVSCDEMVCKSPTV